MSRGECKSHRNECTRSLQTFPANRHQANCQVAENWQPNSTNLKYNNYKGFQKSVVIKSAKLFVETKLKRRSKNLRLPTTFERDTQGVYPRDMLLIERLEAQFEIKLFSGQLLKVLLSLAL